MNVITIKRKVTRRRQAKRSANGHPIQDLTRRFVVHESNLEFVLEALLFTVLLAISAWPIAAAAVAVNEFLQGGI